MKNKKAFDLEIGIINDSTEIIKDQIKLISAALNKMKSQVSSSSNAKQYYKHILESEKELNNLRDSNYLVGENLVQICHIFNDVVI